MRSDDLVPLLVPPPTDGLGFRQGTVETFNSETGENTIDVGGTVLSNVPMLNSGEAIALKAGHVVALLTWKSSWWILGRVTLPNSDQFASASVSFDGGFVSGNNFSIDTTIDIKAQKTFTVPAWADEAAVMATSMISARNDSASSDTLNGRSVIDGINGQLFNKGVAVNEVFDVTLGQHEIISVTNKTSFNVDIEMWTGSNFWPANTANNAALSTQVLYRSTS